MNTDFTMWAIRCASGKLLTIGSEYKPYLFATRELAEQYPYLYDADKIEPVRVVIIKEYKD